MESIILLIAAIVSLASGVFEAVQDTVNFDFKNSIFKNKNPRLWCREYSGGNKWKNGDKAQGEKFFLSSTVLVWMTDIWHRMKMFQHKLSVLSIALICWTFPFGVLSVCYVIAIIAIKHISFEMCFRAFKIK